MYHCKLCLHASDVSVGESVELANAVVTLVEVAVAALRLLSSDKGIASKFAWSNGGGAA